jgi:hypothetical protein
MEPAFGIDPPHKMPTPNRGLHASTLAAVVTFRKSVSRTLDYEAQDQS